MNKNIDLTKILKDCPKGWKFYSPIGGEVEFKQMEPSSPYPIIVTTCGTEICFTKEGFYFCDRDGAECLIFPQKEQRYWSKFSAPWYKKLVEPKFKVGDKIVNSLRKYMGAMGPQGVISEITDNKYIFTDSSYIYISNQDSWELVSNKKPKFDPKTLKPFDKVLIWHCASECWSCEVFSHLTGKYTCNCICGCYTRCMPYNDDTKHLVGTTDEAPEYYKYWEG